MKKHPALKTLLKKMSMLPKEIKNKEALEKEAKNLQLKMLKIQQGIYHKKERVVIIFEGFDAAGKGGAIRKMTEILDPRGFRVIPIGPPTSSEAGIHWLYRFWKNLPRPGTLHVFDRSWYGRVLVERVDELVDEKKIKAAYEEINQFEAQLQHDGIRLIKIFLAITKDEQLRRFNDRINDPYKQWKIGMDDINARKKWGDYVHAVDVILKKCNLQSSPWHLVEANSKTFARREVLKIVTDELDDCEKWIEKAAVKYKKDKLKKLLKKMESA